MLEPALGDTTREFAAYPPEKSLASAPPKSNISASQARQHWSILAAEAAEGPNLNGHYRIVQWGCGANCIQWAVVDLAGGDGWFAPDCLGPCLAAGERSPEVPEWVEDIALQGLSEMPRNVRTQGRIRMVNGSSCSDVPAGQAGCTRS